MNPVTEQFCGGVCALYGLCGFFVVGIVKHVEIVKQLSSANTPYEKKIGDEVRLLANPTSESRCNLLTSARICRPAA